GPSPRAQRAAQADVRELGAGARAAKQQAAAAHVAAADEIGGEPQALAQHRQQRVDVLAGRDAAEQHHLAALADAPGEPARVAVAWLAVTRIGAPDVDGPEAAAAGPAT